MQTSVLIIDDDRELCGLLGEYLGQQGFDVHAIHDGAQAIDHLAAHDYAAVVLDIMLPGMQGLDVLRRFRERRDTPVLMLTARGEDTDRIVGLELGADDYLPKPCNPRELVARLRAILRRAGGGRAVATPAEVTVGALCLHSGQRSVTLGGIPLSLTSAEFHLLQVLMRQPGSPVDKETLSREALGRPLSAYDRSIDVHVSKIRKKLAEAGGDSLILSVRGKGYQLVSGRA
jgi:DNA-binding response OmpR family regulator